MSVTNYIMFQLVYTIKLSHVVTQGTMFVRLQCALQCVQLHSTLIMCCSPALMCVTGIASCLFHLHSSVGGGTQEHVKNITLERVSLDVVCDVVEIFEHAKEIQCTHISDPQEVWLLYAAMHTYISSFLSHVPPTPRPPVMSAG